MKVAGEAENAKKIFELLKEKEYDLLILDIGLPDMNGLEVLNKLMHSKYKLPVLVLSAYPEDQYAVRLIKSGASGYLNKMAVSEQLINAIKKVISGGYYVSDFLSNKMVSVMKKDDDEILHEKLSPREFDVMCLIASGKTIKEIADKLFLGVPTVYTYHSRILEKMNMTNDSELIQYCIKEKIVL
jgi:DNA-binding NarL/FixJ family response regulator